MSFIRFAGDAGKRIDIGPFDTTGIVDATTITSVLMRVSHRDGEFVDWDATLVNVSTYSVTATTVTDGIKNAEPGLYKFRCYFYVDGDIVMMQDGENVFRMKEGSAPAPAQPPPYDGWQAEIDAATAAAAAATASAAASAAAVTALDTRVDALESDTGGGLPQSGTWTGGPLTLADNRYYTATANGDGRIVIAIAPSGHVVGAQALIYIAANTLADPSNLVLGADFNIANSAGFDPALATWITITRLANGFLGTLDTRPALDVTTPTIVSATIESATPTKLDVVYAERTIVRDVSGLTLSSPARTLTLDSGNGTTTHRYTISGAAFVGGEAGNFVAVAGALQDMNGNVNGALSQAYVNNAGVYVMPRAIGRWKASNVVQEGTITSWPDLSGNGNTLTPTGGNAAAYVASDAAINNAPCAEFDGVNDAYENLDIKISGVDPTDLNDYTILAVVKFDATTGHTLFAAFPDAATEFSGIEVFAEGNVLKVTAKEAANNTVNSFTATTWGELRIEVTPSLRRIYRNGVLLTELGSGFDNADDTPAMTAVRVGRLVAAAFYFFDGRIAELGYCSGTMSGPEVTAWDAYVASEYSL